MTSDLIKTEIHDRILLVTLNRPEVHNAINLEMHQALSDCWDSYAADPNLWVAILTGAGDKAFTAGNDLKATADSGFKGGLPKSGFSGLTSRFDLEKPIIAAINGLAMGGGLETALSCDIILASETAKFALPEAKVGFFPSASGVQRLSRYIGRLAAQELMMTGRIFDADEALRLGCINEILAPDELMPRAMKLAEHLCSVSPSSLKAMKRILNAMATSEGLPESLDLSLKVQQELSLTNDFKEGIAAFVEKRKPNWSNS